MKIKARWGMERLVREGILEEVICNGGPLKGVRERLRKSTEMAGVIA